MIDWTSLDAGQHRICCPDCSRGPKDRTCGVTIDATGRGVLHCFRCSLVSCHRPDAGETYQRRTFKKRTTTSPKREALSDDGAAIFASSDSLSGTTGAAYLKARGCCLPPDDGDLRFHPALRHHTGYVGPALVALVTNAITGAPMSLHRTWVQANGEKADIDPPRMLLGGHKKAGGVIRLWPDEAVSYGLGVGEGIETSLTLARVLKPTWALIDAGNLAAFPVLLGIECLTIAADHDAAGMKAADTCAVRWTDAGCDVRVVKPPRHGQDLNDFARAAAA